MSVTINTGVMDTSVGGISTAAIAGLSYFPSSGSSGVSATTWPASNRLAIYSNTRANGWTGNCCRYRRISDNAEIDIGFVNNVWDVAAMNAHGTGAIVTIYDQSGNGFDCTQATDTEQLSYQPDKQWNDSVWGMTAYPLSGNDFYDIPVGVTGSSQNVTVYSVDAGQAGIGLCPWQLGTTAADRFASITGAGFGNQILDTVAFREGIIPYSNTQPTVTVVAGSASELQFHANQSVSRAIPAATSATFTGGFWGKADATYNYYGELFTFAVYSTAHDLTTIQSVKTQLYAAYSIPSNNTKRLNVPGDSVGWGQTNSSNAYAYPWTRYLEDSLSENIDIKNTAVPGRTLALCIGDIDKNDYGSYRRDYAANVQVIWAGSNDIFLSGTTATALYASLTTYVANLKSMGYYVIVADVIARDDASAPRQAERVSYNALVAANTAGADQVVQLSTTFNDFNDTTLFALDKIHLTTPLGYSTVASLLKPAIETGLATTLPAVPSLGFAVGDIPNVNAFYNTTDISLTNILTDGNYIYQFVNSSTGGDLTQTTHARRPLLMRSRVNGRPAMMFAGSDSMTVPSGLLANPNSANTVIIVYRSANTGDATQYLLAGFNAGSGWRYGIALTATSLQFQNRTTSSATTDIAATRDTNVHICGFTRSGVNITPFLDGVAGTTGTNSENFTATTMSIGANVAASGNRFNGDMPVFIMCNAALSNAQLNTLGSALATYYGGTWTGL